MADTTVGVTTPENMRELLRNMRWLKNHWSILTQASEIQHQFIPPEPEQIYFRNDSAFEVPKFGCMKVTGTVEADGQNYITIDRPDGSNAEYLLNGPVAVPPAEYGIAQNGPVFRIVTDGSSQSTWGADTDTFLVTAGDKWKHIGNDDIGVDVVKAVDADAATVPQIYIAQATSAITARSGTTPGSGTADVLTSLSGTLATTPAISLTVYNVYDVAVSNADYLLVVKDDIDDRWWAVPKGGGSSPTSQRIRGTIKYGSGAGFNSATAADPHVIENIEGIDAVWSGAAELDIYNPEGHKLWDDSTCNVRAEYNATSGQWEVYSAQADQIVHGIRRLECKFEKLDGSDGWDWWNSNPAGTFDAEWVTAVYTDPTDDCNLVFDTDCISGVLAASLDFVERVTWNEYTCELAVQYRCEERVTYPGPFTLDFVKDVVWSEGSCELFIYRCDATDNVSYEIPFIKGITWSDALCTIVVTYCDNSQAALAMPDFLTNVEYNEDNCMLYVESCSGAFSFYELDFVKDVTLSADNCNLIVDKCVSGQTEIQMPYVTDVYVIGDRMVYDTGCTSEQLIIEFTECE